MAKLTVGLTLFHAVLLALKSELWQSKIQMMVNDPYVLLALKSELWQSQDDKNREEAIVLLALKSELWQSFLAIVGVFVVFCSH